MELEKKHPECGNSVVLSLICGTPSLVNGNESTKISQVQSKRLWVQIDPIKETEYTVTDGWQGLAERKEYSNGERKENV